MEDVIAEITSAETEKALRNMTNGKAIPVNLLVEVWVSLGRTGVNLLRETLNKITDEEKIPYIYGEKAYSESESEIFIRSFQTQETSAKTITGRCRRGHLEK